jgi:hypothetical protein
MTRKLIDNNLRHVFNDPKRGLAKAQLDIEVP